jgi:hypothetical protein
MNERFERIEEAHEQSFRWILPSVSIRPEAPTDRETSQLGNTQNTLRIGLRLRMHHCFGSLERQHLGNQL